MGTLTLLLVLFLSPQERVDLSKELSRSLYLPIRFSVCDHFSNNTSLHFSNRDGDEVQLLGYLPVTKTFQFTYYPNLKSTKESPRLFRPELLILKIAGDIDVDGETLKNHQYITITPDRVYLSKEKYFDLDKDGKTSRKFRYNRDVRYEMKYVKIQCDQFPHGEEEKSGDTE